MMTEDINILEETKKILEEVKQANIESKALMDRAEKLKSDELFSGKSEAGIQPIQVSHEQEVKDRVNKLLLPTGLHI